MKVSGEKSEPGNCVGFFEGLVERAGGYVRE